jgi:hypothetical protein
MVKQLLAFYPGRFQPFGKHHAATFLWIKDKFGDDNSFIITSDKVSKPDSPFNFMEKKAIIDVYGFGDNTFKVKNPYKAEEIVSKYDPEKVAVVFAIGKKDADRLSHGKYFEELPKDYKLEDLEPSTKKGYFIVTPHISLKVPGQGEMSGTAIRSALAKVTDKDIEKLFNDIFGWYAPKMAKYIVDKIKDNVIAESKLNVFDKASWNKYFTENVKPSDIKRILTEGGAGGHMSHPFDFTSTGSELIDVFKKSIESISKGTSSVKIDGVNASIRLANIDGKRQFTLDRGSASDLDIKGVTKADLPARFPQKGDDAHGFVKIGGTVIDIFDSALSSTQSELKKLGLLDNPNILLNIEYVEGKTNVVGYENIGNFLSIHGLKEIKPKNIDKTGKVRSRETSEISYSKDVMDTYINKLNKVAKKFGFKVLGSVGTEFKSKPNLNKVLSEKITLPLKGKPTSKSLGDWLKDVKIATPLITRKEFVNATNMEDNSVNDKTLNDSIVYLATIKLGDEILSHLTSEIGELEKHEGIVIRDNNIYSGGPFKITGKFILQGMDSKFTK